MAKDPAVLFYTQDFITGTLLMTNEQRGKYILLLCLQHQNGKLTERDMLKICGEKDDDIWCKFYNENGYFYNKRMFLESEKRQKYSESRRQSRLKSDEDNVRIYLLKDEETEYIKIGSSVNPIRRYNEITNQQNSVKGSSENRSYNLIWYSSISVIRKTESELQDKFKNKLITGEWYSLTSEDISIIKTYVERTENENENENENINEDEDIIKEKKETLKNEKLRLVKEHKKQFALHIGEFKSQYPDGMLLKFYNYWSEMNKSGTQMRWEMEKTWELSKRLTTWSSRDKDFQKPQELITYKELIERFNNGEKDMWDKYEVTQINGKQMWKRKTPAL